jgi:hypothetical protein
MSYFAAPARRLAFLFAVTVHRYCIRHDRSIINFLDLAA